METVGRAGSITETERANYAKEEHRNAQLEREEEEWEEGDFDDEQLKDLEEQFKLDRLIVDTRDWMYPDLDYMLWQNAFLAATQKTLKKHPINPAKMLEINRYISASNWILDAEQLQREAEEQVYAEEEAMQREVEEEEAKIEALRDSD